MTTRDGVNRRKFLKLAGVSAGAVAVAGCSGGDSNGTEDGGAGDGDSGGSDGSDGGDTSDGSDGGDSEPTGRLVYSRPNHISSLDFMTSDAVSNDNIKVLMSVYDSLLSFEPGTTTLAPGLATEWDVSDTTVTLTLREDVTFHNGDSFTAEDVVATYRRYTDSEYEYFIEEVTEGSQNTYANFTYGQVNEVVAEGEYEVRMELEQPYAPILRNLAMWSAAVLPKGVIESEQDLTGDAVGTGPFELDEIDDGNQRVFLTARDGGWFGDGPYVAEVVFNTIQDNSTRVQSLISGESQLVDGLTPNTAGQVQNGSGVTLRRKVGGNVGNMEMNLANREEFRDNRVREAIKYAVDTQTIVEEIYQGYAQVGTQPATPTMLGFNEDLEPYPHDPEQARSLLEEAGYGDGFSVELATFQNARAYHPAPLQTAEVVRSNLGEVGIEVEINQMPFGEWLSYAVEGNHELIQSGWVTDNADPDNILFTLLDPGLSEEQLEALPDGQNWIDRSTEGFNTFNFSSWYNEEFVQNVRAGRSTYDTEERRGLYEEANRIAHEEGTWVTYGYQELLRGVSNQISNYNVAVKVNENLQTIRLG